MKYVIFLLLVTTMFCSTPTLRDVDKVRFVDEPKCTLFQAEEWDEEYIRTFGEIQVIGTVENVSTGTVENVMLIIGLYEDYDCTILVYEGESFICSSILAGAKHEFSVTHEFEYVHEGKAQAIKVHVSGE